MIELTCNTCMCWMFCRHETPRGQHGSGLVTARASSCRSAVSWSHRPAFGTRAPPAGPHQASPCRAALQDGCFSLAAAAAAASAARPAWSHVFLSLMLLFSVHLLLSVELSEEQMENGQAGGLRQKIDGGGGRGEGGWGFEVTF